MIPDMTETKTIPTLIIFGKAPFSFVNHVKYANIGEIKANTVQPIIYSRLYTPFVIIAVA